MELTALKKVLDDFGFDVVTELSRNLEQGNIRASGELEASIKFTVKHLGNDVVFRLMIADYYKYVDEGRPPTSAGALKGTPTVRERIKEWIKLKGINPFGVESPAERGARLRRKRPTYQQAVESLSWAISKSIHEHGYKGTKFYSKVITKDRLEELRTQIAVTAKKDILLQIKST